jgi:hypothetical protein
MAVAITRDARGRVVVPPRPPGMRRRALHLPVRAMVDDLSRDWGVCFATEAGLRRELYRRTGYICGLRSIARCIKRGVARGELGQERIAPYARRVDGDRHHPGTTHTWIVVRREQRKARRRAREEKRQAEHKAARAEREKLELEQRAREETARELAARYERRHTTATTIAELVAPPKLASLLSPSTPEPSPSIAAEQERQRRERIAEQLDALARAFPKKPPDQ